MFCSSNVWSRSNEELISCFSKAEREEDAPLTSEGLLNLRSRLLQTGRSGNWSFQGTSQGVGSRNWWDLATYFNRPVMAADKVEF